MSIEVKGRLVNLWVRASGTSNPFKQIVCAESSEFSISTEINKKSTNCGKKATPGTPDFNATVDAVQNLNPSSLEAAYQDIKAFILAGTKVDFQYMSDADAGAGVGVGDGIYNYGSGYFSELTATGTTDEALTYSVTLEGVGTLDVYDTQS